MTNVLTDVMTPCNDSRMETTETLATIAAEYGIDTTTARIRMEGFTADHIGNGSPLSAADASLVRSLIGRCTCTDPAVACPACLAKRDRNGWPTDWRQRMAAR
jgi:hypothetical protein